MMAMGGIIYFIERSPASGDDWTAIPGTETPNPWDAAKRVDVLTAHGVGMKYRISERPAKPGEECFEFRLF